MVVCKAYSNCILAIIGVLAIISHLCAGETWHSSNGPEGGNISTIGVFDSVIIAGTYPGGLYRSINNAELWTACVGTRAQWITGVGRLGSILIAAANADGQAPYALSFSFDGGISWKENSHTWPFMGIEAFAVHRNSIFVKVQQGGVYRSDDTATTWIWLDTILPKAPGSFINVRKFEQDRNSLYAATDAGIMVSKDIGKSWIDISGNIPDSSRKLLCVAASGETLFVGNSDELFRSFNGGTTWLNVLRNPQCYIFDIVIDGQFVAVTTTNSGILASKDMGNNWEISDSSFPNQSLNCITKTFSYFLAGTLGGIYKSSDGNHRWVSSNRGLTAQNICGFTINGGSLYTASRGGGVFVLDQLPNPGWSWFPHGPYCQTVNSIASSSSVIVVGTMSGSGVYYLDSNYFKELRFNNRLSNKPNDYAKSVACLDTAVYIGASGGLYYTIDNGKNVYEIHPDILGSITVNQMAINQRKLYIATSGSRTAGFFVYSIDDGTLKGSLPESSINSVGYNQKYLFAGVMTQNIQTLLRSINDGDTWEKTTLSLPLTVPVSSIACTGDTVFAGTDGMGIFRSFDYGDTWQQINEGLTCPLVKSLFINGYLLYAGTNGGSVFYLDLRNSAPGAIIRKFDDGELKRSFAIVLNHFEILCKSNLDINSPVFCTVFNSSGRLIYNKFVKSLAKDGSIAIPIRTNAIYCVRISTINATFGKIVAIFK